MINWLKCSSLAWILQFYPHFYQNQTLITQTCFLPLVLCIWILTLRNIIRLVEALELDTQAYSHVSPEILTQFKALIRKYPMAFYLPGAELRPVTGFHHNIYTGDSPPVYHMPYRKSPAEFTAIKDELKRMLKMHIIQPSHSEWGAPCTLVRKPSEKGVPQPPHFVVDYRGLNKVTVGDGYPIPSVSNILDALSGDKLFGKLDLASGYWQVLVNP